MVTEVAQTLIDVLATLWEKAHESRAANWPNYIQHVSGRLLPQIGTVAFKPIGCERSNVNLGRAKTTVQIMQVVAKHIDELAAELWRMRAQAIEQQNTQGQGQFFRYRDKDLAKVHPDAPRQIYQIPSDCFPEAAAVFWSYGQALLLYIQPDGMAKLCAVSIVGHGRRSQLTEMPVFVTHFEPVQLEYAVPYDPATEPPHKVMEVESGNDQYEQECLADQV